MLRGIAARSLLTLQLQLDVKEKQVMLELRRRKTCQEGTPFRIPLGCLCHWTQACPYCSCRLFLKKRKSLGGKFLFVNRFGGPVTARGLARTFAALSDKFLRHKGAEARPHSARLSGARFWLRPGASLDTTATIGCWSDIRTLKSYAGSEVLAQRLGDELQRKRDSKHVEEIGIAVRGLQKKMSRNCIWTRPRKRWPTVPP